ncbi:MAG: DUF6622 family protein [Roseiarcus sp.]|jgi:hypothetical protein
MSIFTILGHTPLWVWPLLAFLVYRGVAAMQPRAVSPGRMLIIPAVFLVWGCAGLIGTPGDPVWSLAAFLAAGVAGLALGRGLAALSPPPGPAGPGLIAMPGSPVTLILILAAFATKYAGNVALALAQDAGARAFWSTGLAAAGGLFAGLFWGRTLGLLWRALGATGEAPTLAGLARMALSPAERTGAAQGDG